MGKRINFDNCWRFFRGDLAPKKNTDQWGGAKARAYSFGAAAYDFDDSGWEEIELPHDFVIDGDYTVKNNEASQMRDIPEMESINSRHFAGGCLEGGAAWYRKKFFIDRKAAGKRIYIHFGGIYRDSCIYMNEYYIDRHESGYSSFYYDITDFVNIGEENLIAIRVDSSGREGWWYEGGGIYRHVWLEFADSIHTAPYGIFVSSKADLKSKSADINISIKILNKEFTDKWITVKGVIENQEGDYVDGFESGINILQWDKGFINERIHINEAQLWDIDSPYMYNLKLRLYDGDRLCDENEQHFGIRDMRFDSDTGFWLNGRNLRIQGLCCHHDHAGVGIGIPDDVNEYRIHQMKSVGANAYRSAHHAPSDELLDICDKEGMLVFAETRRMSSAPEDIEALRSMVKHGRNHPCIFLWGIGNEEIFSQNRSETARTTRTMKAEIHKLDPTRPVTSSVVCWDGKKRFNSAAGYIEVTKNLDIMGFNYCIEAWDDYHHRMPDQPIMITEATSNSWTRGCYCTNEEKGQYFIYDDNNINKCKSGSKAVKKDQGEKMWRDFAARPYLAGIFIWTGIDYRGEPTPLTYPSVYTQFGIFDYCGFEKDNFYYYKSWWKNEPVLHIFPHWNHKDKVGQPINIYCYSNLDEAEIIVNGKSYGRKKIEKNWYQEWSSVIYEAGEVKAIGYKNGKEVMVKFVRTTGAVNKIELKPYKDAVRIGGTAIINVQLIDENGVVVPDSDNEISFNIRGAGKFVGTGNGNPGDHAKDRVPIRRAFNGRCQLLVKVEMEGDIEIMASSDNIIGGACIIKGYR